MGTYKTNMALGLVEHPEEFLRYAIGDTRVLPDLYARFVEFVRAQQALLGMAPTELWRAETIPMTLGRLGADTFSRWLHAQAGDHADALRFCVRKLGYWASDAEDYQEQREIRHDLARRLRTLEALTVAAHDPLDRLYLKRYGKAHYLFTALDSGGVRWWS